MSDDRRMIINAIMLRLQESAKARSRDHMTGISDARANWLALDVYDLLVRDMGTITRREIDRLELERINRPPDADDVSGYNGR